MVEHSATETRVVCVNCSFEASVESDAWSRATHPTLGSLRQCPECGSTNTMRR